MGMPTDIGIIDTMIGFPFRDKRAVYDFITKRTKDSESKEGFTFPAQYMFKEVPDEVGDADRGDSPVDLTLREMDRYGIEKGLVGIGGEDAQYAVTHHPDRFIPGGSADPNQGMDAVRGILKQYETWGIRSVDMFPSGFFPQVAINDKKMYPIYAKCVELGIAVFVCAGVPGPRLPFEPQKVEYIDEVMYDFPELVFVTRHGCEPWEDLAVKLMLKWPNLYYSTSAFAPKYYPKAIIDYANTRGADKIIYAGYFPMGLSMERIMGDMPKVPFKDEVWPKFLRGNAARVLGLSG
jgi:predicted TIM-barrel fold metal-dependent hydrolase